MASGSSISILILYYSIKNIQVCLVGCFVSTENYRVGGAGGGRRERGEGEREGCVCVCVFSTLMEQLAVVNFLKPVHWYINLRSGS